MAQDSKRGLFASLFGSKKKTEEELEAEHESRMRLEERIRDVLVLIDSPKLDTPALELQSDSHPTSEKQSVAEFPSVPSVPEEEPEFTYLHPAKSPQGPRKSPSRYRPHWQPAEPAQASQSR